jgi:hypothetical protein
LTYREVGNLIDLSSKPGSVVFTAHRSGIESSTRVMDSFLRDEGHTDGGECYVTFAGCSVNLGNGFIPKSGVFQVGSGLNLHLFHPILCSVPSQASTCSV